MSMTANILYSVFVFSDGYGNVLGARQTCVETSAAPEQMTVDTTSKHIADYHHKNDRIKDVRIGFEPPSWDVAGWVENLGKGGVLLTFVIDFYPLYLLGALLAHTACSPRLRQAHSKCRRPHTHTNTQPHFPFFYHHTPGRGRIDALGQFSKCGSVQMRHIKWLVINLARQLQTPQLLSVINSIGAWGLVLLLVWASSALLTRTHYSQDYSPDKGTFSGTYFCAIFVGKDLQVVFREPDV